MTLAGWPTMCKYMDEIHHDDSPRGSPRGSVQESPLGTPQGIDPRGDLGIPWGDSYGTSTKVPNGHPWRLQHGPPKSPQRLPTYKLDYTTARLGGVQETGNASQVQTNALNPNSSKCMCVFQRWGSEASCF